MIAHVLSTAAPATLDCLLGSVLPAVVTHISSPTATGSTASTARQGGVLEDGIEPRADDRNPGRDGMRKALLAACDPKDIAALHAICRLTASVAACAVREGQKAGPVWFREKLAGSELRELGPLGKEVEISLAEAFFFREAVGTAVL